VRTTAVAASDAAIVLAQELRAGVGRMDGQFVARARRGPAVEAELLTEFQVVAIYPSVEGLSVPAVADEGRCARGDHRSSTCQ